MVEAPAAVAALAVTASAAEAVGAVLLSLAYPWVEYPSDSMVVAAAAAAAAAAFVVGSHSLACPWVDP